MTDLRKVLICLVLTCAVTSGNAEPVKKGFAITPASRYFRITMDIQFAQTPDQEPATETISTEVAVRDGKPGSCKARMLSQVPIKTGGQTKYIELGTKLDCDDVHLEGDGIGLQFTLETSGFLGMAKTKGSDGVVFDEPMLAQRSVQLAVKLPSALPKAV